MYFRRGAARSSRPGLRWESTSAPKKSIARARFARPQLVLGLVRAAIDLGALAAIVRRPPGVLGRGSTRPMLAGAAAGAGLSVVLSVPPLPIAAIARRRAIGVGLVTQSWRGWAGDLLKSTAIEIVLTGAGGGAVVLVTRRYPRAWWLPAAVGSVAFGAVLATLAPVVLDPVFNDFTPLPEGETRSDVLELAQAAGVKVGRCTRSTRAGGRPPPTPT